MKTVGELIKELEQYPKDIRIVHINNDRYEGNDPQFGFWKIPTHYEPSHGNVIPNNGKWFRVDKIDSTYQFVPKDAPVILGIS